MQYLNDRGVEFNSSIVEYDIRHAQINIMRYYNLFEDTKLLDVYDALPKDKRERQCGLLLRKYPDLAKSLEKGFNDIVIEFLNANNLDKTDDIVSIKKDAVFVINKPVQKTIFGPVEFVRKNSYHGYINIGNIEFYVADDKIDVKGLGDAWIHHEDGILMLINDIINTLERNTDEELLYKYLNNICVMYKYRKFDVSMYREFNSSSKFRCNVDGKTMLLDNIGYDYLDEYCDISYNYVNIILPIIRMFL